MTCAMSPRELREVARGIAELRGLDPVLVAAVVEQESGWRPEATRYEEHYRWLVVPAEGCGLEDSAAELRGQRTSWGLLQIMGANARSLGLSGPFEALLRPGLGLEYGCRYLAQQLRREGGNVRRALSRYNSGSPASEAGLRYADQVLARMARLLEARQ